MKGMAEQDEILSVDLLAFEQGDVTRRRAMVDGLQRSLRTGFVYARHDILPEVIDEAYELLARFFHLPDDQKRTCGVPGSMGQTGYTGLLVETAASRDVPDWKEMLNWGRELPAGHPLARKFPHRYMPRRFHEEAVPGLTAALALLWERLEDLQRRILRAVAAGIGCHESFFDGMLTDGPTLCRAIRYPPMREAPEGDVIWAGEHADINLITALPRATRKGLQLLQGDTWVDVLPPAGHAVINTGMMLERVTNGLIPAGVHRVIADPDEPGERFSVVQFCHPGPWTILEPALSCVRPQAPQRWGPIQAGDWLDQVLFDINLIEDARRVTPSDRD
jgi:isopenicillin N synthase-like dioxygenase